MMPTPGLSPAPYSILLENESKKNYNFIFFYINNNINFYYNNNINFYYNKK